MWPVKSCVEPKGKDQGESSVSDRVFTVLKTSFVQEEIDTSSRILFFVTCSSQCLALGYKSERTISHSSSYTSYTSVKTYPYTDNYADSLSFS
jgi:hypothetical protein